MFSISHLEHDRSVPLSDTTSPGLHDIKKLPLAKQIEKLLINAKVLSYSEVCSLLEIQPSREVMSVLQDTAVLIQVLTQVYRKQYYFLYCQHFMKYCFLYCQHITDTSAQKVQLFQKYLLISLLKCVVDCE